MKGAFLALRKPEENDLPILTSWFGDRRFRENLYESESNDYASRAIQILHQNASDSSSSLTLLAETSHGIPAGLLMFQNLNWKHRNVEMNVVIGDPHLREWIYGSDLYLLGLLFAFTQLNLHKVYGYTYVGNDSADKINQFAAKKSGVLRQHFLRNGQYVDVTIYSILKKNFLQFLKENQYGVIRIFIRSGMFASILENDY